MENNIEQQVLDKIKRGNIAMKPRAYFALRLVLAFMSLIVLFLFIVYLASFVIFSLRASGAWFLPGFGFLGIRILSGSLPWLLIFLAGGLVLMFEYFAEYFSFIYKKPVIISLFGIIAAVALASFLVDITPLHPMVFRSVRDNNTPLVADFYSAYGLPPIKNVYHGMVVGLGEDSFTIETPGDELLHVSFGQADTSLLENIEEGDAVVVVGERNGDAVRPKAMRKTNEDKRMFKPHKSSGRKFSPPMKQKSY